VKTLILSDVVAEILHSGKLKSHCQGVELILSCGDLPSDYLDYVVTMLNVPLLYVLGNHDRPRLVSNGEWAEGPEGGRNVDRDVICVGEREQPVCVAGLEGSMRYNDGLHQYSEREMRRRAATLARRLHVARWRGRSLDVLLTHAAPRGVHDGDDLAHRGFAAFTRLIERFQPRYAVHGHVHPSYGYDTKPRRIGRTTVMSVYRYTFLEI